MANSEQVTALFCGLPWLSLEFAFWECEMEPAQRVKLHFYFGS